MPYLNNAAVTVEKPASFKDAPEAAPGEAALSLAGLFRTRADNIDRNVVMRVGLPMFTILMKKLGISQLTVSGTGLWYGIYFQNLYK